MRLNVTYLFGLFPVKFKYFTLKLHEYFRRQKQLLQSSFSAYESISFVKILCAFVLSVDNQSGQ